MGGFNAYLQGAPFQPNGRLFNATRKHKQGKK